MKTLPFISLFFIALLLPIGIAGAQVIKEIPQKQELDNYTATLEKCDNFTNVATIKAIKQHPTWPHDVWSDKKGNLYISFYYSATNPQGYKSEYFDNYGNKLGSNCRLTLKLVEPYYGLNVTEENNTTTQPIENTTAPVNDKPVMILNNSIDNSTIVDASGNHTDNSMNTVENSTGTIRVQGNGNSIQQIILDLKNLDFSNAKIDTINFFVGH